MLRGAPSRRLWYALATAWVVLVGYLVSGGAGAPWDKIVDVSLHDGLMIAGAALCLWRVVRVREERWTWLWITAALIASATGDTINSLVYADASKAPDVLISDAFWLLFLPFGAIGLALLVRCRFPRPDAGRWIEGMQAALIVAALGLMSIFYPVLEDTDGSGIADLIALTYPIGDIVLMGTVLGVCALTGWRPGRSWIVLGGGFVVYSISDAIYSVQVLGGGYSQVQLPDAGWPAAHLLIAYAAWMPAEAPKRITSDDWRATLLPHAVAVVSLVIQVGALVGVYAGKYEGARLLVIVAQTLVLAKLAITPRSFRRLRRRDALTGLGNRFALDYDLDRCLRGRRATRRVLLLCEVEGVADLVKERGRGGRDDFLRRSGRRLGESFEDPVHVYRLELGEFVVLAPLDEESREQELAARALHALGCEPDSRPVWCGAVVIPDEAEPAEAVAVAETRLAPGATSTAPAVNLGSSARPSMPASDTRNLGGVPS